MLVRRRAVKQKLDEEEGYKVRLEALDTEYRAVLEQVELFMELCQAVSVNARSDDSTVSGRGRLNAVGTPSAELMVHMQRVHHSVETAETSLEQVMQQAEQREQQMMQGIGCRKALARPQRLSVCYLPDTRPSTCCSQKATSRIRSPHATCSSK